MIEVTPQATRLMASFFKDKPDSAIRLYVNLGGCGIRTFGVAMEAARKGDLAFHIDGFTYIINRKLYEKVKPIRIHSDGIGFRITGSGIQTQAGCGNCGFMCGATSGARCSGDCDTCTLKCAHGRKKAQAIGKVAEKR